MADRDALEIAVRALRARDRTVAELETRLAERGVGDAERSDAIETLARAGFLDDGRVACARAAALADRGAGDALIRADLVQRGVAAELVEEALGALEDESTRAQRVLARRGRSPKTVRYLASRGFGEETLEEIVARSTEGTIG
jgi:regulatory protein